MSRGKFNSVYHTVNHQNKEEMKMKTKTKNKKQRAVNDRIKKGYRRGDLSCQGYAMAWVIVDFYFEGEVTTLLRASRQIRNARRRQRYESLVKRGVISLGGFYARRLRYHQNHDWSERRVEKLIDDISVWCTLVLNEIIVSGRGDKAPARA